MFLLAEKAAKRPLLVTCRRFCHKFDTKDVDLPKVIEPEAVKDLQVLKNVKKVRKVHSFLASLFLGKYDVDFLTFPEVLSGRKEFIELRSQSVMINKYFRGIVSTEAQSRINQFNFNRLWKISKCETISVLEAVGESLALKPEDIEESIKLKNKGSDDGENKFNDFFNRLSVHPVTNSDTQLLIFDLILHNCLSFATVQQSTNEHLKQRINLEFETNPLMKIGFAWNERTLPLGALPYPDWESEAKISTDGNHWVISGKKSRILKQDYDYYVIFCRTHDFPDASRPLHLTRGLGEPEPGIVALLVRNDQIAKKFDEGIENGIPYETIQFEDVLLPREHHELQSAQVFGVTAQNLRGFGQVGTAAFILGQMKALLSTVYEYLVLERRPLADCELIQSILADTTRKIYAIESVVYMVGAMYDCFDHKYYSHLYLEAAATKIIAVEYAYDIIRNIQMIFGSKLLTTSPFIDLLNIFNSFLDGNLHNRMLIGLSGMRLVGQHKNDHVHKRNLAPYYPYYNMQTAVKKHFTRPTLRSLFLKYDFKGYLHPSLCMEGDQLEFALRLMEHATDYTIVKYAKDVVKRQCDINRLSQIAIDIFMLNCVLARASRAYCDGIRNGDCDVYLANAMTQDALGRIQAVVSELERTPSETQEFYNEHIHNRNLKFKGYFPFPPLDKTFY